MIEAYAFFAAFTVQILVLSVLSPVWLTRYARAKAQAQLPGLDPKSRDRFLSLYRAVNAGIAVLGLGLLVWLFNHMRSPDWDVVAVARLLSGYTVTQIVPLLVVSLIAAWIKKKALMGSPPAAKRTASLERHGLFEIVSPVAVFFAGLAYVLFVGFIIYVRQHPVPGFTGYASLSNVTLVYAVNAICIYWLLYRRKRWPLETRAYRTQAVEVQVKIIFYVSFVAIIFLSLRVALNLLHLQRWMPFAVSVYIVIIMLFTSTMMFALRRQAEVDRLGSSSVS
jgi:hypothetical protein